MSSTSSSVQQAKRALGQRLREIRKGSRLTGRALAELAGWHESKCSRIENGKTLPSEADIHAWTLHCGAQDQVADLIATARGIEGMYVEWRRLESSGLRWLQESIAPRYERTRNFRAYSSSLVAAVAARMERQRVLHEGDHEFMFLVEESALRARIGGAEVMAGQLDHLHAATSLPRVTLGVVPMNADRVMWPVEGFWIFDEEHVEVELRTAQVTVTKPEEIATYARTFTTLSEMAVYGEHARELIEDVRAALG